MFELTALILTHFLNRLHKENFEFVAHIITHSLMLQHGQLSLFKL